MPSSAVGARTGIAPRVKGIQSYKDTLAAGISASYSIRTAVGTPGSPEGIMEEEVYLETCPACGSDAGHYSRDGKKENEEIWLCDDCGSIYEVTVRGA